MIWGEVGTGPSRVITARPSHGRFFPRRSERERKKIKRLNPMTRTLTRKTLALVKMRVRAYASGNIRRPFRQRRIGAAHTRLALSREPHLSLSLICGIGELFKIKIGHSLLGALNPSTSYRREATVTINSKLISEKCHGPPPPPSCLRHFCLLNN